MIGQNGVTHLVSPRKENSRRFRLPYPEDVGDREKKQVSFVL